MCCSVPNPIQLSAAGLSFQMQMKISVMHNLRTYTVTLTYVSGTLIGFGEWNGLGWGIGSTSAELFTLQGLRT